MSRPRGGRDGGGLFSCAPFVVVVEDVYLTLVVLIGVVHVKFVFVEHFWLSGHSCVLHAVPEVRRNLLVIVQSGGLHPAFCKDRKKNGKGVQVEDKKRVGLV